MGKCVRCLEKTAIIMSYFNTDWICHECKQDEKEAPGYERAVEVETEHCKRGDYSFEGVGLSPEDERFLARKRAERASKRGLDEASESG